MLYSALISTNLTPTREVASSPTGSSLTSDVFLGSLMREDLGLTGRCAIEHGWFWQPWTCSVS